MPVEVMKKETQKISNWQLFWIFFRIGCVAWGGFMALISTVRYEVVTIRKLLDDKEVLDGVSLASLLPGPLAMNVVAYVGNKIGGRSAAVVSTVAVTLPSFLLVLGFSILFAEVGNLQAIDKVFSGILPAIAAIIFHAAYQMRENTLKRWDDWVVAILAALLLVGIGGLYSTVGAIICAGIYGALRKSDKYETNSSEILGSEAAYLRELPILVPMLFISLCVILFFLPHSVFNQFPLVQIFATFSGMSLTLFGGGYVFIPVISEVVVGDLNWLTDTEFAAAIAIGQVTPGPILISATFIGYKVAGFLGAVVATIAIFLPPAVLMLTASRFLRMAENIAWVHAAQAGIRAAVIGLVASAGVVIFLSLNWSGDMQKSAVNLLILTFSLFAVLRFKISTLWILPTAGCAGFVFF
jgi:chromate transporter